MKTPILILFVLVSTVGFAQEGVTTEGNTLTMREIAPVWPGCEGSEAKKQKCFNEKLALHISENFDFSNGYTPADKGTRILVNMVINKEGEAEIKSIEGGSEALQKEAKRVILLLPKMKPGSIGGKPTSIKYTVPFSF
ncbi:MAG TPA: energy transducer TonB [Flavobacteriaceae bacterium]|nr:energy transducer TonB [Flavobacteriaceae bacterium]